MFFQTSTLCRKSIHSFPVPPVNKVYRRNWSPNRSGSFNRQFWRVIMDENHANTSFWASDFRHKYLMKTGTDFHGQVPATPQAGMYQKFEDTRLMLHGSPKPSRESRHLPIMPLTPRVVYEHDQETKIAARKKMRTDRHRVEELKNQEFWGWFMKLQRVRGRWCKEQGVSSRGIYGPAVDAAELWG